MTRARFGEEIGKWSLASRGNVIVACLISIFFLGFSFAQEQNPVEQRVTNPITDTPSVNPPVRNQSLRPRLPVRAEGAATGEELTVDADRFTVSGPPEKRVFVYEGNVDARIGVYRLQADRVSVYEAENRVVAEGRVILDQQLEHGTQRITGTRAEWNYATKTGYFINSTGFTSQTQDGTVLYFTAERVEKVSADTIIIVNGEVTACDEEVPKWSFRARHVEIRLNDRVRLRAPGFYVKGLPVLRLPYASIPIKRRDRASGFLTPTFGFSGSKGFRFSEAYYLTLGRSADLTLRGDIYTARGLGFGADLRTRANERSHLNVGFFAVKDRIFGEKEGPNAPNQGGSSLYVDGVHYFANGFLAVADVNITSSLAFRQVFSDSIQQAVSPEERLQIFINRNFGDYSLNFLANSQTVTLSGVSIRTRRLPSISFEKRPSVLALLERLPLYFSLESSLEGVSRKETFEDPALLARDKIQNAIVTPSMVQRLDLFPRFDIPFYFAGWSATIMTGLRATYYSNSLDPATRQVTSRDLVRNYGEFELDLRPPALARDFRADDGSFRFRHVIEPYVTYRRIAGIGDDFNRIIIFDEKDAIADTNEIEYGIVNRFFVRRSTMSPTGKASDDEGQPYEALSITVRNKYFFDPFFGGALVRGQPNQFYPIDTFSGFSYGGAPRRFSPINFEVRYRPLSDLFTDARLDLDSGGDGVRALALTLGVDRRSIKIHQTFYYTRAIGLAPSLQPYADERGKEPGTLPGSQWSPSLFVGNTERGVFGGASFFFDFQNRPNKNSSLISSTVTLGYAFDCCAITVQNFSFNVGLRRENRFVFSFRLNGIGTIGTEPVGQRTR
jgi:LPS-assembly protein